MVACMNEADATPDPRALYPSDHCPLCGGDNQCAMAAGQPAETCWCQGASISPEALAAIPAESVGVRCLCPACGRLDAPATAQVAKKGDNCK